MIQTILADGIVAAAAAWLVWSFAPAGLRRWIRLSLRPHATKRPTLGKSPGDCDCVTGGDDCAAPGLPLYAEELGG